MDERNFFEKCGFIPNEAPKNIKIFNPVQELENILCALDSARTIQLDESPTQRADRIENVANMLYEFNAGFLLAIKHRNSR